MHQEPGEQPVAAAASGDAIDAGKGRIFPCPSCGADLTFHAGQQRLACPFCAYVQELQPAGETLAEQDFARMLEKVVERRREGQAETLERQELRCEACGATVEFTGALTSSSCAHCGKPIVRENVHRAQERVPVDGVVPFEVEEPVAKEKLRRWASSLWFAPNTFKKAGIEGRFQGIYLPFWTFDALTFTRYRGERGKLKTVMLGSGKNRKRHTQCNWTPVSGSFEHVFDDVVVGAGRELPGGLLRALEPWPLERVRPFQEELLAGYLAETYETPLDQGFAAGKRRMDGELRAEAKRRIGGDDQRIHALDSQYSAITYKHLLMPVWMLAYRYGERTYQVVVNAATGEVAGQRPYSAVKITLLILALVLLVWIFQR